jgi:Bacteriophage HK97-gp10, putative tail-component
MTGFSIPFAKLAEKMKSDLDTVVRKSTLQVFDAVVKKTPVSTGRARANWNVSKGAVDTSTTESTDASRAAAQVAKAGEIPSGGVVYLANSLPYARTLEYGGYPNPPKGGKGKTIGGYSKQAPAGMVRLSAQEWTEYVQRVIAK